MFRHSSFAPRPLRRQLDHRTILCSAVWPLTCQESAETIYKGELRGSGIYQCRPAASILRTNRDRQNPVQIRAGDLHPPFERARDLRANHDATLTRYAASQFDWPVSVPESPP